MLAILHSVGSTGQVSLFLNLIVSVGTVLAFKGGLLIIGSKTITRFINYVGRTNQHDLLIVAVMGIGFVYHLLLIRSGCRLQQVHFSRVFW